MNRHPIIFVLILGLIVPYLYMLQKTVYSEFIFILFRSIIDSTLSSLLSFFAILFSKDDIKSKNKKIELNTSTQVDKSKKISTTPIQPAKQQKRKKKPKKQSKKEKIIPKCLLY